MEKFLTYQSEELGLALRQPAACSETEQVAFKDWNQSLLSLAHVTNSKYK
jgi:hypothetical protein